MRGEIDLAAQIDGGRVGVEQEAPGIELDSGWSAAGHLIRSGYT
jgi:hypothetical protein